MTNNFSGLSKKRGAKLISLHVPRQKDRSQAVIC